MIDQRRIRTWLEAYGMRVEDGDAEGTLWRLSATQATPPSMFVAEFICQGAKGDLLEVARGTQLSDEHLEVIRAMPPGAYDQLKFEILRDLLVLQGIRYRLVSEAEGRLSEFVLSAMLVESHFTRADLYSAMDRVYSASLLPAIHIQRIAGEI